MKTLALRVDVDTLEGTKNGIPTLLRLLDRHQMQACFYFSLGPDNSGKAIRRIFRKGFLAKQRRTNAGSLYSLKTMCYGVLLPAPIIHRKTALEMRCVREAGHEVAIHAWDHVQYHDLLDRKSRQWLEDWFARAHAAFFDVFGTMAKAASSPAWRANDNTLEIQESYGLDYAGDCRGLSAFYPVVKGNILKTLQVPTTLATLDEYLGMDGLDAQGANAKILSEVRENELNVFALHTEVEGGPLAPHFDQFLQGLQDRQIHVKTLAEWVPQLKMQDIPVGPMGRGLLSGRPGWVSLSQQATQQQVKNSGTA